MTSEFRLDSPAKVNIGLRVLRRRRDGYHDIYTVFQELLFHDTLTFSAGGSGLELTSDADWLPMDESNTCHKAFYILKRAYPKIGGIRIHLEKRIPGGAGLGGGSGNAATVIHGLNRLFELGMTVPTMEDLALQVGADVPFFIRGGTQLGEGIGEKLTPLKRTIAGTYLLVMPAITIDTGWAYRQMKYHLEPESQPCNFAGSLQKDPIPFEIIKNDFERIVFPAHPEIGDIRDGLIRRGAKFASLSGSGSTVFGVFDEEASAAEAESYFHTSYNTVLTSPPDFA